MTIEERIEKLERGLTRARRTNTLLSIILCLGVAMMISGAAVAASPNVAKQQDIWRTRIKSGMPEQAVKSLLGDPKYIAGGFPSAIWYYEDVPAWVIGKETPHVTEPITGIVIFNKEASAKGPQTTVARPGRSKLAVSSWKEPTWTKTEQPPKLATPSESKEKKLEVSKVKKPQWDDPKKWQRLVEGMDYTAVIKLFGQPDREIDEGNREENVLSKAIIYGLYNPGRQGDMPNDGHGWLSFRGGKLKAWGEPFWLRPKDETSAPADNETKTTDQTQRKTGSSPGEKRAPLEPSNTSPK